VKVRLDSWAWLDRSALTFAKCVRLERSLTIHQRRLHPQSDPATLHLWDSAPEWFGVPRAFFLDNARLDNEVEDLTTLGTGDWGERLAFEGQLRPGQELAIRDVVPKLKTGYGGIVRAPTGWGKCLALGTKVLKSDGEAVAVEDVREGDFLLGPDSRSREVLSTTRGSGPMYRIVPVNGEPWECNDAHILTLVNTQTDEVKDVCVEDWLGWSKTQKHLWKQFAPENGVEFYPGYLEGPPAWGIDPYFLGVWYGDGSKSPVRAAVTTADPEIVSLCEEVAASWGLRVRADTTGGRCPTYHLAGQAGVRNLLLRELREVYGDGSRLPAMYLRGTRKTRLAFLAGLLDSDGHHNAGVLRVCQKRKQWAEDIAFLGRSLGFRASVCEKVVDGVSYWRVGLSGDFSEVPFRLARKDPGPRRQKKVATRTGFSVEPIGEGAWAGFTLDGDGRFLLGDFTVTHNTVWACALIAEMGVPTIVFVQNEALVDQWRESFEVFLPDARVGTIQGDSCDHHGYHVTVAMMQSVHRRNYPDTLYDWPGLLIFDEVHRVSAPTFSQIPPMFKARWRVGLSATPRRADGTEDVFFFHLGKMLHAAHQSTMKPTLKRVWTEFDVVPPKPAITENEALLLRLVCANPRRNRIIVDQITRAVQAGRYILVLSKRLKHLSLLEEQFREGWKTILPKGHPVAGRLLKLVQAGDAKAELELLKWKERHGLKTPTTSFCVGGVRGDALVEAKMAQVIFATYQFASEGFDVPRLDTLVMATPIYDPEQPWGRILREHSGKKAPIVVDLRDDYIPMYARWGRNRDDYYEQVRER